LSQHQEFAVRETTGNRGYRKAKLSKARPQEKKGQQSEAIGKRGSAKQGHRKVRLRGSECHRPRFPVASREYLGSVIAEGEFSAAEILYSM